VSDAAVALFGMAVSIKAGVSCAVVVALAGQGEAVGTADVSWVLRAMMKLNEPLLESNR
jgi:hypothetical protein